MHGHSVLFFTWFLLSISSMLAPALGAIEERIDQVYAESETINIDNSITQLVIQNCTFREELRISASGTLSGFTMVVGNSSFSRTTTILPSFSSSSTISIINCSFSQTLFLTSPWSDVDIEFKNNTLDNSLLFKDMPSSGVQGHFKNNIIKSKDKRAVVDWDRSPISSNSIFLWEDNLIDSSASGTRGWYHDTKSPLNPTAQLKLSGNVLEGNDGGDMFYLYHGGGQLIIDDTNVFTRDFAITYFASSVNDYIHLKNSKLETLGLRCEGGSFSIVSGIFIVEDSTIENMELRVETSSTELHFLNNEFTNTIVVDLETRRSVIHISNSTFNKQVTFSKPDRDAVFVFKENEFKHTMLFNSAPAQNVSLFFKGNRVTATSEGLGVIFQGSPMSSNTFHSWEGNYFDTSASLGGNSLTYDRASILQPTSRVQLSGNTLRAPSDKYSFSLHHGGGCLIVDETNTFSSHFLVSYLASSSAGDRIHLKDSLNLHSVTIESSSADELKNIAVLLENLHLQSSLSVLFNAQQHVSVHVNITNVVAESLDLRAEGSTSSAQESQLDIFQGNKFTKSVSVGCSAAKVSWDYRTPLFGLVSFWGCHVDSLLAIHGLLTDETTSTSYHPIETLTMERITILSGGRLDIAGISFTNFVFKQWTLAGNSVFHIGGCHFKNNVIFTPLVMQNAQFCLTDSKFNNNFDIQQPSRIENTVMLVVNTNVGGELVVHPRIEHSSLILWGTTVVGSKVQVSPGVQSHVVFGEGVRVTNVDVNGCQSSDSGEECTAVVSDSAALGENGGSVSFTDVTKLNGDDKLEPFRPFTSRKCPSLGARMPPTSTITISLSRPPTRTSTFIVHTNTTTTSPSASAELTQSLSRSHSSSTKTPSVSIHTDTPSQHTTPSRDPTLSISRSLDPPPPPSSPVPLPSPIPSTVLDTPTQPPIVAESPLTYAPTVEPFPPMPTVEPLPPMPPVEPLPPTTEPLPPTEPPKTPQPAKKRSLMVTVSFGDNEKVGEAVAASGASSVAVTSVFSPTAASKLSRVVSAAKAVSCVMTEDDERPSFFELPIQYPIGDGSMRYYAGGALASAFLCVGLFLVVVLLRNVAQSSAKANNSSGEDKPISVQVLKAAGVFAAVALLFLAPSIVGAAVTVGVHGNSLERRMSLASLFIMFLVVGFVAFMLTRRFDVKTETKQKVRGGDKHHQNDTNDAASFTIEFKDAQQGSMYVAAYQALFDATDNPSSTVKRLYSVEELVVSSLVAGIAGIRPGGDHCSSVSIAILVAVVVHLVYVVYFHPLRTKMDHYFSVFFAVVQVIMGIACVVATKWIETDDEAAAETPLKVLSMTVFIMFVGFFVQTIVQGYWAFHTFKRREHSADPREEDTQAGNQQESTSSSDNDDGSKNAPTTRLQRGVRRTFSEVTTSSDDSTSDDDDSITSSSDDDYFKRGPPPQHHLLSVPFLGASEKRGSCDGGVAPTNPLCEPPPPPPPPPPPE